MKKTSLFVVQDNRAQWLMKSDDFRLDPKYGYRVLGEATKVARNEIALGALHFFVCPDWSLKAI